MRPEREMAAWRDAAEFGLLKCDATSIALRVIYLVFPSFVAGLIVGWMFLK
jgi:hypothetical protein